MNINIPKYTLPDRYEIPRCCECGKPIKSLPFFVSDINTRCGECELKHETERGHSKEVLNALYQKYIPCVSRKDKER